MPGTELAIEKTGWAHTPPTRDDVSAAKLLIVDLTMDYTTGVEGVTPPPPARPTPFHPSPPSSSPSPAPPTPIHTPHPPFSSPSSAGLPTKKEELYGFMAAPPNGMGYPAQFGTLEGLRGKYFAYDAALGHCYGFYTFVDQASLDKCVAPDPRPPPPSSGVPHPSQWRASPRQVRGVQPSPS